MQKSVALLVEIVDLEAFIRAFASACITSGSVVFVLVHSQVLLNPAGVPL